jgi:hypothetical protein
MKENKQLKTGKMVFNCYSNIVRQVKTIYYYFSLPLGNKTVNGDSYPGFLFAAILAGISNLFNDGIPVWVIFVAL